jgi:cytochrome c-type biogenesis protein CcmF
MVVHIGVVVIAVALGAATSLGFRGEVQLRPGTATTIDGHRIAFERLSNVRTPAETATEALVLVDGHGPYRPAVSQFGANTDPVGTPAIDSSIWHDLYLTIDSLPATSGGPVAIGVVVQPLVSWLWVGGGILVLGSLLAAVPGRRRRRPTDPVSAPVPVVSDALGRHRVAETTDDDGGRHGPPEITVPGAVGESEGGRTDERVPAGSP